MNDRPQQAQQGENHDIATTTEHEKPVEKNPNQAYSEARTRGRAWTFRVAITYVHGAEGERLSRELVLWLQDTMKNQATTQKGGNP